MTIVVDYTRNEVLSKQAHTLLSDYYCREGEDPQDAYARAATAFSKHDHELAQRIYDYASKGWFMFSSPILSNAPLNTRTLPKKDGTARDLTLCDVAFAPLQKDLQVYQNLLNTARKKQKNCRCNSRLCIRVEGSGTHRRSTE